MGHDTVLNIVQLYKVQYRVQLVLMLLSACFLDQEPFFRVRHWRIQSSLLGSRPVQMDSKLSAAYGTQVPSQVPQPTCYWNLTTWCHAPWQ